MSDKEKQAIERCNYASQLLTESNIKHEIKKKEIGHINIYYNEIPIMSFWARTGKFIFLRVPKGKIKTNDDRGIKNCIDAYNQFVKLEKVNV